MLLKGMTALLGVLILIHALSSPRQWASGPASWLPPALGVLAFAEVLALCRLLFPQRGTLIALTGLILANFLPSLLLSWILDGRPPSWFTLWGTLDTRRAPGSLLKGLICFALAYGIFSRVARWKERELDDDLVARKDALLAAKA